MESTDKEKKAAYHEVELTEWRMRVDNFMDEAAVQRRITALQMGALETSVVELQGDVRESNAWSKKNHESLATMIGFFEGMDNLRKLADTAMKWGKPFLFVAGVGAACVAWLVKTVIAWKYP
jgi:hypothetical protein